MKLYTSLLLLCLAAPVLADEVVPISPCRILDTRSGSPIAANVATGEPARGLCGVPADATALVVNATVVSPAGAGYLKAYGTSSSPSTVVLTYSAGQTVTTTGAQVGLSWDDPSTSEWDLPAWDFQVLTSQGAHVVVDVTGYLTRLPTKDFQGEVLEIQANLFPDAIVWKLGGERLPVVCVAPWINPNGCGVQPISERVCGTAHIEHYAGGPYAAGPHLIVDSLETCP